jgi:hypothetical protein
MMFPRVVPGLIEDMLRGRYRYEGKKAPLNDLRVPYRQTVPRLKHPGFSEEMEYRIVAAVSRDSLTPRPNRRRKPIKFRLQNNYLVTYIALNEKADGTKGGREPLPITNIIIGPSVEGVRRRDGVDLILKENGYNVDVELSEIPFA